MSVWWEGRGNLNIWKSLGIHRGDSIIDHVKGLVVIVPNQQLRRRWGGGMGKVLEDEDHPGIWSDPKFPLEGRLDLALWSSG